MTSTESEFHKDSHHFDDLVEEYHNHQIIDDGKGNTYESRSSREVNLILDHSAFIRGIGNIKGWFNEEYIKTTFKKRKNEDIHLTLFIPAYTLHQFEFAKKGHSTWASNARMALKFIDKYIEEEYDEDSSMSDSKLHCNFEIEATTGNSFPSWNICLQHQSNKPLIKDFPNLNPEIISGSRTFKEKTHYDINLLENEMMSPSYQEDTDLEARAIIPHRLTFLIRSYFRKTMKKNRTKDESNWYLVTEDPATKVWATSFEIECLNINEAELMIFEDYNPFDNSSKDPHQWIYTSEANDKSKTTNKIHNSVDSTVYEYESLHGEKEPKQVIDEESKRTRKEGYGTINYAPRGSGKLWTPPTSLQPTRERKT